MRRSAIVAPFAIGLGALGGLALAKARDERLIDAIWNDLESTPHDTGVFSPAMVEDLPEVAQRYFLHAIEPGTPLANRFHWHYTAQMKPGANLPWMPLEAEQLLVKDRGFVWKSRASMGPLSVSVRDHYLDGDGRMRIALFGLLPFVNASGPDLSKSAMGRLLIESICLPSSLLPSAKIRIDAPDDTHFTATVELAGESTPIIVTVDPTGRPTEVTMQRWGNITPDGSYQYIPYGMSISEEGRFGGYTMPTSVAGGWWFGSPEYLEVIRLDVDWAALS